MNPVVIWAGPVVIGVGPDVIVVGPVVKGVALVIGVGPEEGVGLGALCIGPDKGWVALGIKMVAIGMRTVWTGPIA